MVKSMISILVAAAIIAVGGFFEHWYLDKSFDDIIVRIDAITEKIEEATVCEDDVLALQQAWISKKEKLHIFIPHTEIKEIDLWISECTTYTKYGKKEDAIAKCTVVKELCEQIPKTFLLRLENLF